MSAPQVKCSSCLQKRAGVDEDGYCGDCATEIRDELRHRALRGASHLMHEVARLKCVAREYGATAEEVARLIAYADRDFEITVEGI